MPNPAATRRHHRWLLLVPFGWQVALAPWANEVQARPLGLPFPMAWQLAGIVLSTVVIGAVLLPERRTTWFSRDARALARCRPRSRIRRPGRAP